MADYTQLVDLLKKSLNEYRYTQIDQLSLGNNQSMLVLKTPRKKMVSYICAVTEISNNITDFSNTKKLFNQIRNTLRHKYAGFPWWKELGTYLIFICPHELFNQLKSTEKKFKDLTGFHMNVMLGTCFIDKDTFENTADATWGLFYSGKHYGAMRATVSQWCEQQKNRDT